MIKNIFLIFLIFACAQSHASVGNFCANLFNVFSPKKSSLDIKDFELFAIELVRLEEQITKNKTDEVNKIKFSFKKQEYINAVLELFDKTGVKVKYSSFQDQFTVIPTIKASKLNEVAWKLNKHYNTKVVFKYKINLKTYTEASFAQFKYGKNIIYLPIESLYNPLNLSVIHEITHAEVANLEQQGKAFDFRGSVGYTNKQKNVFYNALYFEEFLTFADEIYAQGRLLLQSSEFSKNANTVDAYLRLLPLTEALDMAENNHESFAKIYNNFLTKLKYFKETPNLGVKKFKNMFEVSTLIKQGDTYHITPMAVTLTKYYLRFSFTDHAQGNYVKIPIYGKHFIKEFKKLAKQDADKEIIKNYVLNTAQLALTIMSKVNNLVTELDQIYQQMDSVRTHYGDANEILNASAHIYSINKKYLDSPNAENRYNKVSDILRDSE